MLEILEGPLGEGTDDFSRDTPIPILFTDPVPNFHGAVVNIVSCFETSAADDNGAVGRTNCKVEDWGNVGDGYPFLGVGNCIWVRECVAQPSCYLWIVCCFGEGFGIAFFVSSYSAALEPKNWF